MSKNLRNFIRLEMQRQLREAPESRLQRRARRQWERQRGLPRDSTEFSDAMYAKQRAELPPTADDPATWDDPAEPFDEELPPSGPLSQNDVARLSAAGVDVDMRDVDFIDPLDPTRTRGVPRRVEGTDRQMSLDATGRALLSLFAAMVSDGILEREKFTKIMRAMKKLLGSNLGENGVANIDKNEQKLKRYIRGWAIYLAQQGSDHEPNTSNKKMVIDYVQDLDKEEEAEEEAPAEEEAAEEEAAAEEAAEEEEEERSDDSIKVLSGGLVNGPITGNHFRKFMFADTTRSTWADSNSLWAAATDTGQYWNSKEMRKAWRRFGNGYSTWLASNPVSSGEMMARTTSGEATTGGDEDHPAPTAPLDGSVSKIRGRDNLTKMLRNGVSLNNVEAAWDEWKRTHREENFHQWDPGEDGDMPSIQWRKWDGTPGESITGNLAGRVTYDFFMAVYSDQVQNFRDTLSRPRWQRRIAGNRSSWEFDEASREFTFIGNEHQAPVDSNWLGTGRWRWGANGRPAGVESTDTSAYGRDDWMIRIGRNAFATPWVDPADLSEDGVGSVIQETTMWDKFIKDLI